VIIVLVILLSLRLGLNFATGDKETAGRIFDGVGVEALSAIFALVITLSLMVVQMASQQYTHRIMDIHIKSLIFRAVIAIYLGSIFYNVFMLGWLDLENSSSVPYISIYVEISILLSFLSFIMLIPYFYITLVRLKPETVISKLLANIDEDYLKRFYKEGEPSKEDKMLPITEIIEKSISSGDHETARLGIDMIYTCYTSHFKKEYLFSRDAECLFSWDSVPGDEDKKLKEFLRDNFDIGWAENAKILKFDDGKTISIFNDKNAAEILIDKKEDGKLNIRADVSHYFLKPILGIGREAIIREDDDSMKQVLETFGKMGERAIRENLNICARKSVEYTEIIGSKVLKDHDPVSQQMIDSLQGMLRMIIKNGYLFSMDSVPGDDDEKLKEFLREDFNIDWTENAEIFKSDDGKTISIRKNENTAKIIIDEKKEKATLKITDGRTHELKVKTENGKLIIYKREDVETLGGIFTLYHNTSDELFKLKNYQMLKHMENSVSELLDSMMRNRCYDIIARTAGLLESIGVFAVKFDVRDLLHQSVHALYKMGIASAKDKLVWETPKRKVILEERIIDHLLKIEEEALKYKSKLKEFDSIINEIEYVKKDIEKYREKKVDFSDLWC
jgi:hypothetical protein